jgi:hypothetical protein
MRQVPQEKINLIRRRSISSGEDQSHQEKINLIRRRSISSGED